MQKERHTHKYTDTHTRTRTHARNDTSSHENAHIHTHTHRDRRTHAHTHTQTRAYAHKGAEGSDERQAFEDAVESDLVAASPQCVGLGGGEIKFKVKAQDSQYFFDNAYEQVCMYACIHTCTGCMHVHTCSCTRIYAPYPYAHIHTYTSVCTYSCSTASL